MASPHPPAAGSPRDPTVLAHRSLESIGLIALRVGGLLMECGARTAIVDVNVTALARALGAEDTETRAGYASLEMTVRHGVNSITRMVTVGPHGVNHRLEHALRLLVKRVTIEGGTPESVRREVDGLVGAIGRHPRWLVSLAVGVACAAFGRLLGADWLACGPILVAAAVGQLLRGALHHRGVNLFILISCVAFLAALLGGLGARLIGSGTVDTALMASTLLLVPGVPALNAQSDILEGRPTLGAARLVIVITALVFIAMGIWGAAALLGIGVVWS
ncbi:threonine/serine exporter family protein [Rhodospirillum rubrum]|nr:threonine/serine exporter family protein [Rhodospirillum rubrum]QXG79366.1 threonine/serine exporter family protein [Rhodospirillum rubrum]